MISLRAHLTGKEPPTSGKGRSKVALLDLAIAEDVTSLDVPHSNLDNLDRNRAIGLRQKPIEKEDEYYNKLQARLLGCKDCPHSPGCYCLKAPNGAHVRLTLKYVLSWARQWVSKS